MKKGVKKNYEKEEGSMSMTPMIFAQEGNFTENNQDLFYLEDPMSKTVNYLK